MRYDLTNDQYKLMMEQLSEGARKNTPRFQRARRFSDTIIHGIMWDFIALDRQCLERLREHVMLLGFANNAEIINVPPEMDALDKLAIEKAMLEKAMAPFMVDLQKLDGK